MHCGVCCVSVSFHTYTHVGIIHGHGCTQNFYSAVDKHIHILPINKYAEFTLDIFRKSIKLQKYTMELQNNVPQILNTYDIYFLQYTHKRITFLCKSHFTTILAVLYFCLTTSIDITPMSIQINRQRREHLLLGPQYIEWPNNCVYFFYDDGMCLLRWK